MVYMKWYKEKATDAYTPQNFTILISLSCIFKRRHNSEKYTSTFYPKSCTFPKPNQQRK